MNDTIDDDERLSVGIQRIKTTNEHGRAIAGTAGAADGMNIGTKRVLDFGLNGVGCSVVHSSFHLRGHLRTVLIHGLELIRDHDDAQRRLAITNAYLLTEIAGRANEERCGKGGNLNGELTLLVGHGCIVAVVERLYLDTCQRFLGNGIDDSTLHLHCGILRLFRRCLLLDDSLYDLVFVFYIILSTGRQRDSHCQKNTHTENIISFHTVDV